MADLTIGYDGRGVEIRGLDLEGLERGNPQNVNAILAFIERAAERARAVFEGTYTAEVSTVAGRPRKPNGWRVIRGGKAGGDDGRSSG